MGGWFSLKLKINSSDQMILQLSYVGFFPERYFENVTINISIMYMNIFCGNLTVNATGS